MLHRRRLAALWLITLCVASGFGQSNPSPIDPVTVDESFQLPIPIALSDGRADATGAGAVVEVLPPESSVPVVADTSQPSAAAAAALLLPPRPSATGDSRATSTLRTTSQSSYGKPLRTLSSLAVVLGLFLVFVWFVRRHRVPLSAGEQVFHTLGRVSLLGKQAHIVQFGDKLLVLAKTTNGVEKLTELTNPLEVQRVTDLCQRGSSAQLAVGVREALLGNSTASSV